MKKLLILIALLSISCAKETEAEPLITYRIEILGERHGMPPFSKIKEAYFIDIEAAGFFIDSGGSYKFYKPQSSAQKDIFAWYPVSRTIIRKQGVIQ